MKKFALLAVIVIAPLVGAVAAQSPERPKNHDVGATTRPAADRDQIQAESKKPGEKASPARDHLWLKQLVGEWDIKFKIYLQPDQPPTESTGTDSVRALGDHWIIAETRTT